MREVRTTVFVHTVLTIVRCAVKGIVALADEVPKQEHFDVIVAAVAAQLRRERQRRNLSMNAVAELGGLSQQMVSYVERGMRNPTLDTLLRMSAAMKLELADVIAAAVRNARKH